MCRQPEGEMTPHQHRPVRHQLCDASPGAARSQRGTETRGTTWHHVGPGRTRLGQQREDQQDHEDHEDQQDGGRYERAG